MIPDVIKRIMNRFQEHGKEIFIIGGYVREYVVSGICIKDIELVTNANKHDICDITSGLQCRVYPHKNKPIVTIKLDDYTISISQYHRVMPYGHMEVTSLLEHCLAVNFRVDAMTMSIDGKIDDTMGGMNDLKQNKLTTIMEPDFIIKHDRLLGFKAISVASQYGLSLDETLLSTIYDNDFNLATVHVDTLRKLFNTVLCAKVNVSEYVTMLYDIGILEQLVPDIRLCYNFEQRRPNHMRDVFNHILDVMERVEPRLDLRLAAFFHDIGKPAVFRLDEKGVGHFDGHNAVSADIAVTTMDNLGYRQERINTVYKLVYWHMCRYDYRKELSVDKLILAVGKTRLEDLFKLQVADAISCKPPYRLDSLYRLKFECDNIINNLINTSFKLAISPKDITGIGLYSKHHEAALKYAMELVSSGKVQNNKQAILSKVSQKFKN